VNQLDIDWSLLFHAAAGVMNKTETEESKQTNWRHYRASSV
jgi:hypothetical protein